MEVKKINFLKVFLVLFLININGLYGQSNSDISFLLGILNDHGSRIWIPNTKYENKVTFFYKNDSIAFKEFMFTLSQMRLEKNSYNIEKEHPESSTVIVNSKILLKIS